MLKPTAELLVGECRPLGNLLIFFPDGKILWLSIVWCSCCCLERGSEAPSWKMLQPTPVPLTIQEPWINLPPSYLICLPSCSFLKCRVAWMSCTPCQTAKPACPNKSTLPWLYSSGVLIHTHLPLGLGAWACLRNWMAASFPANTQANTPGNRERESLTVQWSGFCVALLPKDSGSFLQIERPSRSFKYSTAVYATIRKTAPTEKNVSFFFLCESRLCCGLLCDLEERQRVVLKEHRVEFLKVWRLGYNSHAVSVSLSAIRWEFIQSPTSPGMIHLSIHLTQFYKMCSFLSLGTQR